MSLPSIHQTKDFLGLLVCCCIKWDDGAGNTFNPSWDNNKLVRLTTLLQIKGDAHSLVDQIKHDIEFNNHWRMETLIDEYSTHIPAIHHEQTLFSILVVLSAQSYNSNTQLKFDSLLLKLVTQKFGINEIKGQSIFQAAKSLTEFTKAIEKQFKFDTVQ